MLNHTIKIEATVTNLEAIFYNGLSEALSALESNIVKTSQDISELKTQHNSWTDVPTVINDAEVTTMRLKQLNKWVGLKAKGLLPDHLIDLIADTLELSYKSDTQSESHKTLLDMELLDSVDFDHV